ncbi:MAG: signal peptide peptidase SppA [candidate division WOR-3 bacterium]
MIALFLLTFYESNSVSTAERLGGARANPAALGIKTGFQALLGYNPTDTVFSAGLGFFGIGLNWRWNDESSAWELSAGQELWRNTLWFGSAWHPDCGALDYGLIIRPHRYLSSGLVVRDAFRDERAFTAGLGLRPLWDRFTIYADLDFKDSIIAWRAGAAAEPLPGVIIHGCYSDDKSVSVGLDWSFGKIRFSGGAESELGEDEPSPEPNEFQIELSQTPYPHMRLPEKKWLDLTIRGPYSEDGRAIIGSEPTFYDFISIVDSAARDPGLSGMLIRLEPGDLSPSQIEELHSVIMKARKRGKFVVFYAEQMGIGQVWLASAGDRIVMAPSGELAFPGLRGGGYYLKGALDKLGLYADFERIKEYKTAAEPLMSDTMSTAQKEQYTAILDDIYNHQIDLLARGRALPPESVDALVDIGFFSAPKALSVGLIDTTAYEDELDEIVKSYAGKKVKLVKPEGYFGQEVQRPWRDDRPLIALIVAEGSIVSGRGGISLLGGKSMGKEVAESMRSARKDKKVKAVVFRVNSGGGSALGSDLIWREVYLTAKEKPVIVSMGDVAGSGGYYISCAGTRILATPATITGSIGIITGKIVMKDLFGKVGITKPLVTTGHKHLLLWEETRKFTDEERKFVQAMLQEGYDEFTAKVSLGRGITQDSVNAIGRGRVWSGISAKQIGLVDQFGGLTDAIALAREQAKAKDARVVWYHPKRSGLLSSLRNLPGALSGIQKELEPISPYWNMIQDDELLYYMMEPLEIE